MAVVSVTRAITAMGLEVAPHKTEAIFLHGRDREAPPPAYVEVEPARIRVGSSLKYLGLTLDEKWGFESHFETLAPKVGRMANALCRLLPNLGGPGAVVRRLHVNTVLSVLLYGASV
ncbi:uncharacterized protein LOC105422099 [Pogonomyrmex barbatus]|uniref:Uncharacterized protein LOC105422099 n=1 Tax=Pogonomyrmex barbatus TaxID=144034 RepID=A0A6I9VME4_9HYME|nr:uncharacterized protein LOC105422099 [Pogonomyrmex barbatus]